MAQSGENQERQLPPSQEEARAARRRLRAQWEALRVGATAFAVLAGMGCYIFLNMWGVPEIAAVIAGFIFALLTRVAAASLLREWILRAATRRGLLNGRTPPDSGQDRPPPEASRNDRRRADRP